MRALHSQQELITTGILTQVLTVAGQRSTVELSYSTNLSEEIIHWC